VLAYRHGAATDSEFNLALPSNVIATLQVCMNEKHNLTLRQGIAHLVKNIQGPTKRPASTPRRPNQDGHHQETSTTSSIPTTNTAANIANAAHFETSKWPCILLVMVDVLSTAPTAEFLPEEARCGPVRDVVVLALCLALDLMFELTRREYTEVCVRVLETSLIHLPFSRMSKSNEDDMNALSTGRHLIMPSKIHIFTQH